MREVISYYRRRCKFCNKPFFSNHGNRLFCDPKTQRPGAKNCKVTYNNWKARQERNMILNYEESLKTNWHILFDLIENGGCTTTRRELTRLGFNFKICYDVASEYEGLEIYQVYDFELICVEEDYFEIR